MDEAAATRTSSMDPERRSTSGKGGKGRGGRRLGMKMASLRAPTPPTPPSAPVPTTPPPTSAPVPTPTPPPSAPVPPTPTPSLPPPTSGPAPPPVTSSSISSPSLPTSGWGPIPPMFPSHNGNQQAPNSWGYSPGGFLNFIQQARYMPQPQLQGENFHLVGQPMSFSPISTPPPQPAPPLQGNSMNDPVNLDNDKEDNSEANRALKKRYWTHEEEERLASTWLNCSKDPVKGNDKRGDTFWKEVTTEFNKKGNGKRTREINQLKVHWSRLKSLITDFNDAWTKVTQLHTSGYSDDMLEEEAQKVYEQRFGKRFLLVHWWKILKDEPKWCAQFETEKNKSEVVDVPEEQLRPIGREAAKAERRGKRKKQNAMEGVVILGDNIDKIVKLQQARKVESEKMTEAQIQISNANLKAAMEQKHARMFEVYNSLLNQDTSDMSEVQMANRDRALRKLEEKLFAD